MCLRVPMRHVPSRAWPPLQALPFTRIVSQWNNAWPRAILMCDVSRLTYPAAGWDARRGCGENRPVGHGVAFNCLAFGQCVTRWLTGQVTVTSLPNRSQYVLPPMLTQVCVCLMNGRGRDWYSMRVHSLCLATMKSFALTGRVWERFETPFSVYLPGVVSFSYPVSCEDCCFSS